MTRGLLSRRVNVGVAVVGIAAVVLVVLAITYSLAGRGQKPYTTEERLRSTQDQLQSLRVRAAELEAETQRLEEGLRAMEARLEGEGEGNEAGAAGLREGAAKGLGLVITLIEPESRAGETYREASVVHAMDLLELANDLVAAGAKAVAINGARVEMLGSIACEGPRILIRGRTVTPPYRIEAAGDPTHLQAALRRSGGPVERMENFDIQVEVRREQDLELPPIRSGSRERGAAGTGGGSEERR